MRSQESTVDRISVGMLEVTEQRFYRWIAGQEAQVPSQALSRHTHRSGIANQQILQGGSDGRGIPWPTRLCDPSSVRFVILQVADAYVVVPATVVTALDQRLPWSLACRVGSPLDLLQLGVGEMSVLRSCCGLLALHEQPAVEHCASSDPVRPGAGPLTARQRSCAAWISLNAIASPRSRHGALVTRVLSRTSR